MIGASCHDGATATGMDAKVNPPHIATSLDCSFCHTTATFVGGSWNHQGIGNNCISCHDGVIATGNNPSPLGNHFVTVLDCYFCHATTAWAPTSFTHSPTGNYPGNHAVQLTCLSCHRQNDQAITYRHPAYAPSCAACHAGDYESGVDEHRSLSQDRNCAGCHEHSVNQRGW